MPSSKQFRQKTLLPERNCLHSETGQLTVFTVNNCGVLLDGKIVLWPLKGSRSISPKATETVWS